MRKKKNPLVLPELSNEIQSLMEKSRFSSTQDALYVSEPGWFQTGRPPVGSSDLVCDAGIFIDIRCC